MSHVKVGAGQLCALPCRSSSGSLGLTNKDRSRVSRDLIQLLDKPFVAIDQQLTVDMSARISAFVQDFGWIRRAAWDDHRRF